MIFLFKTSKADNRLPYLQEIKMHQNEKIQHAMKLCDKLDQLESILWNRYWHEFLTLLEQEDMQIPSVDNHNVDWPF